MSRYSQDSQGNLNVIAGSASYDLIAPKETSPATAPHSQGTQIIYGKALYDVIADIAINDALVVGTNIEAAPDITTQLSNKVSKGVEVISVTKTSIVNSVQIRRAGNVVNATISVTPTTSGFSAIATGFPRAALQAVRSLGTDSGGRMISSWLVMYDTGNAQVYCHTDDINKILLFSITYITSDN